MNPAEFKRWLEQCIKDAKLQGLTDEQIYAEFLDQVRHMTIRQMLKTCKEVPRHL